MAGPANSSYVWLVHDLTRPLSVLLLIEINEFFVELFQLFTTETRLAWSFDLDLN